jgi:hypothetical protein
MITPNPPSYDAMAAKNLECMPENVRVFRSLSGMKHGTGIGARWPRYLGGSERQARSRPSTVTSRFSLATSRDSFQLSNYFFTGDDAQPTDGVSQP